MSGIDYLISAALGYVAVPVAALLERKHWPSQLRFFVAAALAFGGAVLQVVMRNDVLGTATIMAAFGPIFLAQQATFHLEVAGAGSPAVVDKLEDVKVLP